jgi:hypothetical protein
MNTQNGNWCTFEGIDAFCWSLKGDGLYFGTNGGVYKYGGVTSDDGEAIIGTSVSAFSNFGMPNVKRVTMARPFVTCADGYLPSIAIRKDYDTGPVTYTASESESSGSAWDEGEWDVAEWGIGVTNSARWQTVTGLGTYLSFALTVATQERFQFNSVDLMVEPGGYL